MTHLDALRDSLQELLGEYFSIHISIRNKKLVLSEDTLNTIQNAEFALQYATENDLPLPKSTFELCHYGRAVRDKLFSNIEDYQVELSQKRRARRKGSWQLKILGWNEKRIKYDIKMHPEPEWQGKKPEKDEKVFRRVSQHFPSSIDKNNSADFELVINNLDSLFVNSSSKTTEKVKQLGQAYKAYLNANEMYQESKKQLETLNGRKNELVNRFNNLTNKISILEAELHQTDEYKSKNEKEQQFQQLEDNPKTRSFLKLWTDLLHRFIRWIQREPRSKLSLKYIIAIYEDLYDFSSPLEDFFNELSLELVTNVENFYSKKKEYAKKIGSPQQLQNRLKKGKETLFELRSLKSELINSQNNLNNINIYRDLIETSQENEKIKNKLNQVIKEVSSLEGLVSEQKKVLLNAKKKLQLSL